MSSPIRVLYSFPHKLGADRICHTAWQQVNGLAAAGADVLAFPGVLHRPVAASVNVRPTLARGRLRIPYKVLGKMRALALHDRIVARRLETLAGEVDVVHTWPVAARETLRTAARLGIPSFIERPNAHTRFAFEAVGKEFARLGIPLPADDEYFWREDVLQKEEEEYRLADHILCPSEFVRRTFLDRGFKPEKLVRHAYGFDEKVFYTDPAPRSHERGLTILFVGVCAVRKGLHFALEAWLNSPASRSGTFLIAGSFLSEYRQKLSGWLAHSSVRVLGHREDIPELMRQSDILVLPSIEEGFGLVVAEAIGSGCVPLVSDACTEICRHMENGLVHSAGDVTALTQQLTHLHEDREFLSRLRAACVRTAPEHTWNVAGTRLLDAYRSVLTSSTAGADDRKGRCFADVTPSADGHASS